MTLTSGECSRTIAFRSVNGFSEADLYAFVVDGKSYEPKINIPTKISVDCESTDYEIFVRLEMSTFATAWINNNNIGNIITVKTDKPALNTYEIMIKSAGGDKSQIYMLEVEKPFSSDIFVQRWADVLAIDNSATNGGYHFIDYKWLKDGEYMQGTEGKGYIQEKGGLSKTAEYTAELTTQDGKEISTCPADLSDDTKTKAAVYPNPVLRGQSVRVETGIGRDAARHVSTTTVMQLFDVSGNIVAERILHDPVAEIAMPNTPGTYFLQITVNGATQSFKIVVE